MVPSGIVHRGGFSRPSTPDHQNHKLETDAELRVPRPVKFIGLDE
jgi:hypothetical protein